jgi:UDP-N-acetylmuramyl tripeptide synthase
VRKALGTLVGKSVAGAVKLRGGSGGQALPGLVVEKTVPGYLAAMLRQLPDGVVVITGTNGKTTTTKMVVELLQAAGKRVLTNPTGSNLTRGIISTVARQAGNTGKLPFDIAVFELDEAYASYFTRLFRPHWVLGLNASRDQLDRFGEVDAIAGLIGETMLSATTGIITNADDKRLSAIAAEAPVAAVVYFGVAPKLLHHFPRDDELVSVAGGKAPAIAAADVPLEVELLAFSGTKATYRVETEVHEVTLQVTGQHNFQNAAAALALAHRLLPYVPAADLVRSLGRVQPAFGRGQVYTLKNGSKIQLTLVKNPASFRQGLASYLTPDTTVMIAINDRVADSRDMSWLWDVDFSLLHGNTPVKGPTLYERGVMTTGTRAVDMALRLRYDEITAGTIEPNLEKALASFAQEPGDKVIFATYTAMLRLHTLLEKKAGKEL